MFGPGGDIRIIGHRGARGVAPENTVASIRHAVEVGAQAIEIDLHASKDEELVVIHDSTVDRTTDGTGPVDQYTLDELRKLDAGYRFTADEGQTFAFRGQGVQIPALDEAMEAIGDLPAILEVKSAAAGRLLADPVTADRLARDAFAYVRQTFSIERHVSAVMEIYDQLLGAKQRVVSAGDAAARQG